MTSKEFAKLIGVSQSTVSRAMNGSSLVPEEKRNYIHQKAKEYSFALNSHAKSLRTRRTGTIGILFSKHFVGMSTNLMLAQLYDSIQNEMNRYDYDIMVLYNQPKADDFSTFERVVRTQKVDGFLVLRTALSPEEMQLVEEFHIPCVFLLHADAKLHPNLSFLFSDNEYGSFLAGEYLGRFPDYRKMFVTVREQRDDTEERLSGYRRGLQAQGCELLEEDILHCELGIESACACILEHRDRLAGQKTAIFTYNDILGLGVVSACKELGFAIPEQVQVISMDDIPLAGTFHPRLSTIHISIEEMVPRGCRLLIDLIDHKERLEQEWIKPRLILRETTL